MDQEERDEIINKMAKEGIPLASIGRVFGLSRERICQIRGKGDKDKTPHSVVTLGGRKYDIQEVVDFFLAKKSFRETATHFGTTNAALSRFLRDRLGEDKVNDMLQCERDRLVLARLKKIEMGRGVFSASDILSHDPPLYQLLTRRKPMDEWAKNLGAEYVSKKQSRAKSGQTDNL